jgi:hypothetical protein
MVYIDGVHDSQAYDTMNHFEIPLRRIKPHVIGHNKKRCPYPEL